MSCVCIASRALHTYRKMQRGKRASREEKNQIEETIIVKRLLDAFTHILYRLWTNTDWEWMITVFCISLSLFRSIQNSIHRMKKLHTHMECQYHTNVCVLVHLATEMWTRVAGNLPISVALDKSRWLSNCPLTNHLCWKIDTDWHEFSYSNVSNFNFFCWLKLRWNTSIGVSWN